MQLILAERLGCFMKASSAEMFINPRLGAVIQLNVVMDSSNTAKKANLMFGGIGKAGVFDKAQKTKII